MPSLHNSSSTKVSDGDGVAPTAPPGASPTRRLGGLPALGAIDVGVSPSPIRDKLVSGTRLGVEEIRAVLTHAESCTIDPALLCSGYPPVVFVETGTKSTAGSRLLEGLKSQGWEEGPQIDVFSLTRMDPGTEVTLRQVVEALRKTGVLAIGVIYNNPENIDSHQWELYLKAPWREGM